MTNHSHFFTRPRLWGLLCGLTLAVAQFFSPAAVGIAQAATTNCTPNGATQNCTVTFAYSGAPESWTVPASVPSATFDLYGARGSGAAGRGGRVTATLAVTPGTVYQIRVGGSGPFGDSYNGGGRAGTGRNISGGSGGGASDVRNGAFALTDRLLVAGGGGGGRVGGPDDTAIGGDGGYPAGGAGSGSGTGGGGGTQTAGGAGGYVGGAGSLGQGGPGQSGNPNFAEEGGGSGGGGGYFGGGGTGIGLFGDTTGGGGGGSSYATPAATNVSFETGVRFDNGLVIITYVLADTTAPVANPTQSPAAAPSGWNNSNVTVTWNWSDPATSAGPVSGIDPANCTTSSVSIGSGTLTLTATCKDLAGNTGTATYQVKVDPTAPTANPSQSPAANGAGWNNTDVTVNWNWVFTGAIIDTANCTTSLTSSGEGVLTLSATCKDVALNQRTVPYTVKVDKTPPVVTVTGVSDGATYALGTVPTAACSTSDALSGVATQATLSITGGGGPQGADGTGSFTATCSGASDVAGNSAAPVSVSYSVTPPPDTTAPVITPNVVGTLGNNGWYLSDVTVSWSVVDAESAISSQSGCDPVTVNSDTDGDTLTCTATSAGGSSSQSVTIKRDATTPTISAAASTAPNANGWYNSNVTVQFTCADNLSGVVSCPADEVLSSEGAAVSSTAQTITDLAGNSSAASNVVTVQIDKTAPVVTVTGVSNGASYTVGSVPTAGCSTSDALSGVATQATLTITGGNGDGTGTFTATCSGATDNAGNSRSVAVGYTVTAVVDACTTTALRDNFDRANGGLGSNWAGLTGQSFYKIAGNQVDVQLGGPVAWKPTTFGVNQAAFVTLSTLDANSPSQGVLLKVQGSTIPNGGAIAVVYDNLAKAVRVSTLRLNTPAWTVYPTTPATFANGDKLLGCIQANGTVRVYRNTTLLTTVTLNAADQSFFNAKGGKIGLWTVAALNAVFDDFGGGVLTGVTGATLDATAIPDELADDGTEITVAEDFPTDVAAPATPDAGALANRAFLPLVNR